MGYGLVVVKSNKEIDGEQAQHDDAANREITEVESQLSSHIQRAWEINRWAKEDWQDEMLECLRQRNGEYDPETMASIREQGGSEIYMMLTATKIRAAVSWIRDILLPAGDKAWGLTPTPVPDLPDNIVEAISNRIAETLPEEPPEEGDEAYIVKRAAMLRDEVMRSMKEIAEDAAKRMEDKIEDQMVEGNWEKVISEFIEDFCTFPAAIIKGPVPKRKKRLKWSPDGQPIVTHEVVLEFRRVSPFDLYPSPFATTNEDGELIERIRFTRRELYGLLGMPGYNDQAIRAVLQEYGRGGLKDWLWRDYERARLEGKDKYWMRQDEGTIDGIHYYGSVQGLALLEWGMTPEQVPDPLAEYEIDAIKIGRHVIRAVINKDPLLRRGYHTASFQSVPGGYWGISIPKLMRDHQRMCNATARALANNLGIASGPLVEIEADRLADGEVVEQLYPWKIIQSKSDKSGRGREAVRFYQPSSIAGELLAVYEQFERRADDATSIPRYTYGNERVGGAGSTASGLSMLMNNASKGIKLAISNIDSNVIKPIVEQTFTFNMLYDSDPTIKGDVKIHARGATALLTREQAQLRRSEFLAMTNNPVDMEIMGLEGRIELLRANADLLDMNVDKILPDKEQFAARQQEAQEQQGQQQEDPRILELQMKEKLEREKLLQSDAQFKKKMEMQARLEKEKLTMQREIEREKLREEYEYRMRMLDEESRQREIDIEIQKQIEAEKRTREIEEIRERVRLERQERIEKEVSDKTEHPYTQSPIINLVVDNKNGEAKKKIEIRRGPDNTISSAKIISKSQSEVISRKRIKINRDSDNKISSAEIIEEPVDEQKEGESE